MKTTIIKDKTIAAFDFEVTSKINAESTTMRQVDKELMKIGIRNEQGQIYRVIGATSHEEFFDVIEALEEMSFIDELEDTGPKKGYDLIFHRK